MLHNKVGNLVAFLLRGHRLPVDTVPGARQISTVPETMALVRRWKDDGCGGSVHDLAEIKGARDSGCATS